MLLAMKRTIRLVICLALVCSASSFSAQFTGPEIPLTFFHDEIRSMEVADISVDNEARATKTKDIVTSKRCTEADSEER